MNNLEYLNQIAKEARPAKHKSTDAFTGLLFKIIIGGVIALTIVIAIGVVLSSNRTKSTDLAKQLYFRTTTLNDTIKDYNPSLKSSRLRAIGTSLANTLTSASGQLSGYFSSLDTKEISPSSSALASETDNINSLVLALSNAKLNGILDRIYASQIQFQVSILLSLISQTIDHTNNAELLSILQQYYSSIATIDENLQSYSNPSA